MSIGLENPSKNVYLSPVSEKEFNLGTISAGDARDVKFTILIINRVDDQMKIDL